jgi:RNA polymerase sigma factor (sigma-70 family)
MNSASTRKDNRREARGGLQNWGVDVKTAGLAQHDLRILFQAGALGNLSDGELLERFVARRDEPAFEAIVRRHGSMVLGVCRRVLRDHHDAEDAFQATFLVLARKAGTVRPGSMLPNWLYGVAHQTSIKARAINARRKLRERQVAAMPEPQTGPQQRGDDLRGLIDRELNRLPAKYRAPVILCDLEGLGHKEAALRLGWPIGTVSGRLSRARAMLARRLTGRGLALPAGLLAVGLGEAAASAAVPPPLTHRTIQAALPFALGQSTTLGVIPVAVAALSNRILGGMMRSKLIATAGACLAGGIVLFGGMGGHRILAGHTGRGVIRPAARAVVVEDAAAIESKLLQGTWQGVEVEINGKRVSTAEARDLLIEFQGDEILMRNVNGPARGRRSRFKLDPRKTPRMIDVTPLDGQESGQTAASIYTLERGRLMLCIPSMAPGKDPGQRPKRFQTRDGDGLVLFVLERVGPKGPADPGPRDATLAGFEVIQRDYERAELAYQDALFQARTAEARQKVQAGKRPKTEQFAERFLRLAQDLPRTREELFALCWAAVNAPTSEPGKRALAILEEGRLDAADPIEVSKALDAARTSQESLPSPLAPLVLRRAERNLEDPACAGLLTWVCRNFYQSEWPEEPRLFAEAAALLVDRFADSPGIQNFCECLGSVDGRSPSWAPKYERHLRTIVDRNRDRWVLCMAKFALATVVKNSGPARQDEAVQLYESFIKRFEDLSDPSSKHMESQMIEMAKRQIKMIRDQNKGRPAPVPGAAR